MLPSFRAIQRYWRRAVALARRYRVDGRLPPVVSKVLREWAATAVITRSQRIAASALPPAGNGPASMPARDGWRRVATVGPLRTSLDELAVENVATVVDALTAAGLHPFLVDRVGDRFRVGLRLEERAAAVTAVSSLFAQPGWSIRWTRGRRSRTMRRRTALATRRLRRATTWYVGPRHALGEIAIGRDQTVEIGFWAPGTSGQCELVGTRGQERFQPDSPTTVVKVRDRELPGLAAFPITERIDRFEGDIDVVYTWVDGSDPDWRAAFEEWAHRTGRDRSSDAALAPGRYRSRDELRYSLRSVWYHLGWARRIWVVTAGQRPDWLVEDDRLRVVDHSAILDDACLPTFNSHAIEASLHKVPGLAEHFVYFNDDTFAGRSLRPEHFFTPNGLPKVFDSDARVLTVVTTSTGAVDTAAMRGRELLHARHGISTVYKPLHAPHPLRRSTMEELEGAFPDEFERTRHSRFRSPTDVSTATSLALHYGLITGRAVLGTIGHDYVNIESRRLRVHLERLLATRRFDTFCLNETEQPSSDPARVDRLVTSFLAAYFPVASPWEADAAQGGSSHGR